MKKRKWQGSSSLCFCCFSAPTARPSAFFPPKAHQGISPATLFTAVFSKLWGLPTRDPTFEIKRRRPCGLLLLFRFRSLLTWEVNKNNSDYSAFVAERAVVRMTRVFWLIIEPTHTPIDDMWKTIRESVKKRFFCFFIDARHHQC